MKKVFILALFNLLFLISIVSAQVPTPVVNNEIRDNASIRSRTIELERVKRETRKLRYEISREREIKFAEIKEDFEDIQKLQLSIIKIYTTGKVINYAKLGETAAEMTRKAVRLNLNLFYSDSAETNKKSFIEKENRKSVKDLIVELDEAIGTFVKSPIFKNIKLVDLEVSEKSRIELERILKISYSLSVECKKMP